MSKILVEPLCGKNTTAKSVFLDRAENVLHDVFGGVNYWKSRRSMVFSKSLRLVDYISSQTILLFVWKSSKIYITIQISKLIVCLYIVIVNLSSTLSL